MTLALKGISHMKQERFRRVWMLLSAFGIVFAVLSWFHEAVLSGNAILWKGPLAVLLGLGLYFIFVDRV
jgi:hypothetical protein